MKPKRGERKSGGTVGGRFRSLAAQTLTRAQIGLLADGSLISMTCRKPEHASTIGRINDCWTVLSRSGNEGREMALLCSADRFLNVGGSSRSGAHQCEVRSQGWTTF